MKISCNWNDVLPTNLPTIQTEKFSKIEDENLITATLMMPFDDIHASYEIGDSDSSQKIQKTKNEIQVRFKQLLKSPPKFKTDKLSPKTKINFTLEEDFLIYTYVTKYSDKDLGTILKLFKDKFYPIRTEKDILNRIEEIKNNTPEENDEIITNFARQILHDKLVCEAYENNTKSSIKEQQRCLKLIEDNPPFTHDSEINLIDSYKNVIAQCKFTTHELAALISETCIVKMMRSRMTIGYSHQFYETDFDLRLASPTECCHISKKQAIISFLPDGCFYIENIGSAIFRVNGVIIPPKKVAHIPDYALLDFCDQLYIFVPNTELTTKIHNSYLQSMQRKKKSLDEPKPSKPQLASITLPNGVVINP